MLNQGLMSSKTDEWETPQDLFDMLNNKFHFDLDPCATPENAKCAKYYTKEDDGLSKPWHGRVFMNPPYGRQIGKWVAKAVEEVLAKRAEVVVALLPARTDTEWWHEYVLRYGACVMFIRGRLKFGSGKHPAPFPSVVVVFFNVETDEDDVLTL